MKYHKDPIKEFLELRKEKNLAADSPNVPIREAG